MLKQVENNKNIISTALQVVKKENFRPDNRLEKREHEELKVIRQDKVQLKTLKILQNTIDKLSDRSTPKLFNKKPRKTSNRKYVY